ncbi:unnamed protein product [Symbiodinium natans]|uniref:Uncharacterized protein n=1 Tax=Symbiodinium natans TaxID=878477 RepID=A0A812ICV1_9DINO|nr:unnamed protein product [Symbiodinium natans]
MPPARQNLCSVVELLQCALLPCLSSRSLAVIESACKESRRTIIAGELWAKCFSLALPDFDLSSNCLTVLNYKGDGHGRCELKRILGTLSSVRKHSVIDLKGVPLPLPNPAVAKQLLSKVEIARMKAMKQMKEAGVPGRVLMRHICFREEAQVPAPYRSLDVICRASEPIFFDLEKPDGRTQSLALQLKWVENEVRLRIMLVQNGTWPFPVSESEARTLAVDVVSTSKVPLLATRGTQVKLGAGWYPTSGITAAMMPTSDLFRLLAHDGLTCVIAVCEYVESHAVNAGLSRELRQLGAGLLSLVRLIYGRFGRLFACSSCYVWTKAKGEHPMDLASSAPSFQSPVSVVPELLEAVSVRPGLGVKMSGKRLRFGAMPQDIFSDFGPPQQVCVKDMDAFRIHSRASRPSSLDYYYNYFYLGMDVLFDGQTHLVQKIVLHANPPTHERFSRYTRCFFQLQIEAQAHENHHRHHEADKQGIGCGMTALFTMFGMSSWWVGNAIFAQLPLLVSRLPESDSLGAQLSMMVQAGNIFSISYKIIEHHTGSLDVNLVVNGMHQVSLLLLMFLALFWDSELMGRSIPLLAISVLAGGLGCLSDLTYWSLVMRHPPPCTKAVGVGMSLGNFVVLGLSTLQVSGRSADNPRFGVSNFFALAAIFQLLWGIVTLIVQDKLGPAVVWAAGLVSESLGKRVLDLINPMHEKAVALLRAEEEANKETIREVDHPGPRSAGLPRKQKIVLCEAVNFCTYAATYTLPCILPFVAASFPERSRQCHLLLRMMIFQSIGDVSGRMLAPTAKSGPLQQNLPLVGGVVLPLCFSFLIASAVDSSIISDNLSYDQATLVLPLVVMCFFFSRGMLVSAIFLRARGLTSSREAAEHLASTMGFCGQMGALSANVITFAIESSVRMVGVEGTTIDSDDQDDLMTRPSPESAGAVCIDIRWLWPDIEEALQHAGFSKSRPLVMNQRDDSHTSFGSTYFYAFPGLIFEVMQNGYLASLTLFQAAASATSSRLRAAAGFPWLVRRLRLQLCDVSWVGCNWVVFGGKATGLDCSNGRSFGGAGTFLAWIKSAIERPKMEAKFHITWAGDMATWKLKNSAQEDLLGEESRYEMQHADVEALAARDPALKEILEQDATAIGQDVAADAAFELYRQSLIALDAGQMLTQKAFKAVAKDNAEDLRRLFDTTSLRWNAENAGGQSLIEVALERSRFSATEVIKEMRRKQEGEEGKSRDGGEGPGIVAVAMGRVVG